MDPLAEVFPNWNPYNYVMQDPLRLTDTTGMSPVDSDELVINGQDADEAVAELNRESELNLGFNLNSNANLNSSNGWFKLQ